MDLDRRIADPEIMDTVPLPPEELRDTLRFLSWINRNLGGDSLILGLLERWSARWPSDRPATLLDVGTGGAQTPIRIVEWARREGLSVRVTAIDSTPEIARLARENARAYPEIRVLEADLLDFARGRETFDYVLASLVFHHIPDDSLVPALRACDALAGRGVIVSDLLRSRPAFWSARALTMFGNRVVRNDGPLSVRRAFTLAELGHLAEDAGLGYLAARRHPFFRLSLAGEKDDA